MKIKVYVQTNYVGSRDECEFEVDDDTAPKEVDEMAREAMFEMIDWGYTIDGKPA